MARSISHYAVVACFGLLDRTAQCELCNLLRSDTPEHRPFSASADVTCAPKASTRTYSSGADRRRLSVGRSVAARRSRTDGTPLEDGGCQSARVWPTQPAGGTARVCDSPLNSPDACNRSVVVQDRADAAV